MTKSDLDRDRPVMMSSTMPSAKYSWLGSPLIFSNGSTAMEGLSGKASGTAMDAVAKDIVVIEDNIADMNADA